MLRSTIFFLVHFVLFFITNISCVEDQEKIQLSKSECQQIKDIMTDCLGIHRGALNYVDSCGSVSLEKVKALNSCDDKLDYIRNRNQE